MAKKRKKNLSPEERRLRSLRRLKRRAIKTALVLGLIGAGYVYANPEIIQNPTKRQQVEEIKDEVTITTQKGEDTLTNVLGNTTDLIEEGLKTLKVPQELTGQEEEVVVEEVVKDFTEEVKNIPAEQVKKIKLQFCQDVIEEINQP